MPVKIKSSPRMDNLSSPRMDDLSSPIIGDLIGKSEQKIPYRVRYLNWDNLTSKL